MFTRLDVVRVWWGLRGWGWQTGTNLECAVSSVNRTSMIWKYIRIIKSLCNLLKSFCTIYLRSKEADGRIEAWTGSWIGMIKGHRCAHPALSQSDKVNVDQTSGGNAHVLTVLQQRRPVPVCKNRCCQTESACKFQDSTCTVSVHRLPKFQAKRL